MNNIFEAIVEEDGRIRLRSSVHLQTDSKVSVSIPQAGPDSAVSGFALSERSLSEKWLKAEEEA
jgi:hypothetical protein